MQETAIKVLVVDDDEDIRETTATFLADLGYRVSCAATGEEAIRLIEADAAVTLLLTDIQMPGALDGWALAHLARTIRPDLKIVYVTGLPWPASGPAATLYGPIVRKPFRLLRLAQEIKRVLEQADADVVSAKAGEEQARHDLHDARREIAQSRQDVAALRAAIEKAEAINRAKTRLLAAVGHDLRQPLTIIMGTFEMVAAKLGEPDQPMVARAAAAATRLGQALDSVLEASRLEFGSVEPAIRPIKIAPLLAELGDEHGPDARRKGLTFTIVDSSAHVMSDPILLGSVLHNLVGNAVKYTVRGSVLLGCRWRDGTLQIQVCDTGIGIPAEMLETIFDEYRRLDTANGTGFGLGLAIAKRTADLLGHELTVRSTPSKGSVFALVVPLTPSVPLSRRRGRSSVGRAPR